MKLAMAIGVSSCVGLAAAQPVSPVDLGPGTVGPFFAPEDDLTPASDGAWFVFTLFDTFEVDIDINRNSAEPDLVATLFSGDVTGLDMTLLSPDSLVNGVLVGSGSFGPLTVIDFEDDTEDDPFGGPFGDPRFTLTLQAGTYSLLVASLTPFEGGFFTITSNVPTPSGLAALGLAGLVAARRRR